MENKQRVNNIMEDKEKKYSVVTCASFGSSGSGVVTDFLGEFEGIYNPGDYEFRFLQDYGGVTTLEDCLVHSHHRLNSDIAIKNFIKYTRYQCGDIFNRRYNRFFNGRFGEITEAFLKDIIDIEWPGYWEEYQVLSPKYVTIFKYKIWPRILRLLQGNKYYIARYVPRRPMYYSNPTAERFQKAVRQYVRNLCSEVDPKGENRFIYFDQLMPPDNIDRYFNYFDDLRVIVVDRDPRDYYIENVLKLGEGWVPEDVDKYIALYKGLRSKIDTEHENNNIKRIQFEDAIFKYDEFKTEIMSFLQLSESSHVRPLLQFNPAVSRNNVQLWKKVQVPEGDVAKIEKELGEYCYNFPKLT